VVTPGSGIGTASPGRARLRRRWVKAVVAAAVAVAVGVGGVMADALSAPGSDPASAKLAEWARDHGLGSVVTALEAWQYAQDQPAIGGEPDGGIPRAPGADATGADTAPLAPLAGGPPLPGEGTWQVVATSGGRPAVEVAYLRPDGQHTGFVAGVLRMSPTSVRGQLHPGTRDPGGTWPEANSLAGGTAGLVAAFNGGFRLSDPSRPGYYSDGRAVAPLVDGQASLVIYRDGHADVGAWNRDVHMTPQVVSVRQNLVPLVNAGQVNPDCASGGQQEWGDTIGQAAYIDRSGFGVTADGHEVYVAGPALSVCTLGAILADAGVVRGMELDINPAWVSGAYFATASAGRPVGHRLYPDEKVDPGHYFSPSSRDWFAWHLR
jgi:hypothetical protein